METKVFKLINDTPEITVLEVTMRDGNYPIPVFKTSRDFVEKR
ncbi:MAG: hypothetical protein ACK40U_10645 [Fervidobacterium pennivorans]